MLCSLHTTWNYLFKLGSSAGLGWNQYTGRDFWPQKLSITASNSKCQILLLNTMGNQLNWGVGGSIGFVWCNYRCLEVLLFLPPLSPECTAIYYKIGAFVLKCLFSLMKIVIIQFISFYLSSQDKQEFYVLGIELKKREIQYHFVSNGFKWRRMQKTNPKWCVVINKKKKTLLNNQAKWLHDLITKSFTYGTKAGWRPAGFCLQCYWLNSWKSAWRVGGSKSKRTRRPKRSDASLGLFWHFITLMNTNGTLKWLAAETLGNKIAVLMLWCR